MSPERETALRGQGGTLTAEEWREGWHFCPDFDHDLVGPPWADELGSCEWCGFDGSAPYPGLALDIERLELIRVLCRRAVRVHMRDQLRATWKDPFVPGETWEELRRAYVMMFPEPEQDP